MNDLQLRLATMNDAAILLEWRNDEATRNASRNRDLVTEPEHLEWLDRSFQCDRRQILIGEIENEPVGTVRTDRYDNEEIEISWTVNPAMRGQGIGTRLVKLAVEQVKGKLVAYIREDNQASQKIALSAGFARSESKPDSDIESEPNMVRFEMNR